MIVAELKSYIIRTVSLRDRGVITESEAAYRVLEECVFTVLEHAAAWPEVVAALELVPLELLSTVASILAEKRLSEGGWEWPITGGIATDGSRTQYRRANPTEEAILEKLFAWLNEYLATHRS